MTGGPEVSAKALTALRRLAGSLGAIPLPGGADELVDHGYASPIGSGFVITDRGRAALDEIEQATTHSRTAHDDPSATEDEVQKERLF